MSDHEAAIQALHERARAFRSRIQVRAWEQRQIEGSKGTWYRVRRLLARAERAYAASDEAIEELVAAGARCDPVGEELEPRKRYVLVTAAQASRLVSGPGLVVRLSAELLAAKNLVLVAFEPSALTP